MRYQTGLRAPTEGKTGVLLVNLGTPEAATAPSVRRYLGEFLHDHRVVELTRWIWCLILHGIVLRLRPRKSAAAYAKIWGDDGSPLMVQTRRLTENLAAHFGKHFGERVVVAMAMRYGHPSVASAMDSLAHQGVERITVLPLYPQFSCSTSASVFDAVGDVLRQWRHLPSVHIVRDYYRTPGYVDALAESVREHWARHPKSERLVMSFHGTPQRYSDAGDPYRAQCEETAESLARRLGLNPDEWMLTFQSRFGKAAWLTPYTDKTLEALAKGGTQSVDVICPGFAVDCLETLEEIAQENAHIFCGAGGKTFRYIPCLNDRPDHTAALAAVLEAETPQWFDR